MLKTKNICFTPSYANLMNTTLQQVKKGMKPKGFVTKYLHSRCIDEEEGEYSTTASKAYVDRLKRATSESIHPDHFSNFIEMLEQTLARVPITKEDSTNCIDLLEERKPFRTSAPMLLDKMVVLIDNATHKAGVNRKIRWSKYHTQISIWAIPFIFFSLTPFFNASWRWIKGEKLAWNKTVRTVKNQMHTTEKDTSDFIKGEDS